jgi:tagatose-1,6-bisphosphate aldolase non-catalytic subunit AgaZ/GatZ
MSRNGVHAAIRMAYRHQRKVMLVASRGQVECEELGGGYVERWFTEGFTNYVRERDPDGLVAVCRDHGGPWQHPDEVPSPNTADVLRRTLVSLRADIRAGMELIHLDTSREGPREADFDIALSRLVELYRECHDYAHSLSRQVLFEVGLERQGGDVDDPEQFQGKLERIVDALAAATLPPPTFVVGQTGTHVMGTENRGVLAQEPETVAEVVAQLAHSCWRHGLALKAHNADYLPDRAIVELLRSGTDAVNIAPEFGVTETQAMLALLEELGLARERERFLTLAFESGAWRKWFDEEAGDLERAVAAGHYVFSTSEFRDIKNRAEQACQPRGVTVDDVLGWALDRRMERYAGIVWAAG